MCFAELLWFPAAESRGTSEVCDLLHVHLARGGQTGVSGSTAESDRFFGLPGPQHSFLLHFIFPPTSTRAQSPSPGTTGVHHARLTLGFIGVHGWGKAKRMICWNPCLNRKGAPITPSGVQWHTYLHGVDIISHYPCSLLHFSS